MIFGYTEDKNKVEVPSKEEVDERLSDTGWVVFAEAGKYGGINLTKPLKYRKIGKLVEWRGAVGTLDSSNTEYMFGNVPAELVPADGVTNKYVVNATDTDGSVTFTDFEMVIACPTPAIGNMLRMRFRTTQAFNTVSTDIDFMYFVD